MSPERYCPGDLVLDSYSLEAGNIIPFYRKGARANRMEQLAWGRITRSLWNIDLNPVLVLTFKTFHNIKDLDV